MVKRLLILLFILSSFILGQTIDPPAGYTNTFQDEKRLKLYDDDDWPGADSLNDDKNIIADAFRKSEFEVGITRVDVVNGAFVVSSGMKVDKIITNGFPSTATIRFQDVTEDSVSFFQVNDVIMAKDINNDGTDRLFWVGIVTAVTNLDVTITKDLTQGAHTGTPDNGDVFVRIGNTTTSARQSSILLLSDLIGLNDPPKILLKNNVTSYGDWIEPSKTYALFGNMKGEYGYINDVAGLGVGSYSDDKIYMTIDTVDGFQIQQKDVVISKWDNDASLRVGRNDGDNANVTIDTTDGFRINKGFSQIAGLNLDGKLTLGENADDKDRIEIAGGDGINFYTDESGTDHISMRLSQDSLIIGRDENGEYRQEILSDRISQYYKTAGGDDINTFILFQLGGQPYVSLGAVKNEYYRTSIFPSGLQQIYRSSSGVDKVYTNIDNTGVTIGLDESGEYRTEIKTAGIQQIYNNSGSDEVWTDLSSSGLIIGLDAPTYHRVELTPTSLDFIYNSSGTDRNTLSIGATTIRIGQDLQQNFRTEIDAASYDLIYKDNLNVDHTVFSINSTPNVIIGEIANNQSRVEIGSSGVEIINRNGAGVDNTAISLDNSGNATFEGEITASSGAIGGFDIGATSITSTNLGLVSGTNAQILLGHASSYANAKIGLKNDGSGKLASGNIFWDASGNLSLVNDLEISSVGVIRSGQTAYNTGTGFWLGQDGGVPKFSIGSTLGYLTWDGTTLDINGQLTAGGGSDIDWQYVSSVSIDSADINTASISSANIKELYADKITAGTLSADRIAAGSIDATKLTVDSLSALSANMGTITAGRIKSGNLEIDTTGAIRSGQIDYNTGDGFWLGDAAGTPKFSIGTSTRSLTWDGVNLSINDAIIPSIASGSEPSIQGWSHSIFFQPVDNNTVSWGTGNISLTDGTTYSITSSSNTGNMSATTYIFFDANVSTSALQTDINPANAVGPSRILIAVARQVVDTSKYANFTVFGGNFNGITQLIEAENIVANTITANEIASNTITANEISAGTITTNEILANTITGGNIAASTITASNLNVDSLSAVSANLGLVTAGILNANGMKFGTNVNSTFDGIYLGEYDYWYSSGIFNFGGANGIYYNGSAMTIGSSVTIAGSIFSGGITSSATITGGTFRTDTAGVKRIEINGTNNAIDFYDNPNFATTRMWEIKSSGTTSDTQLDIYNTYATTSFMTFYNDAGFNSKIKIGANVVFEFNSDVNLYRSVANVLKTDDALDVGDALSVTNDADIGGDLTENGEDVSRWRGVLASAPSTDIQEGDMYFNSGDSKVYIRANSTWVALN